MPIQDNSSEYCIPMSYRLFLLIIEFKLKDKPMTKINKVIIGLGNPGKKYTTTRHNIGFRLVEEVAKGKEFHHENNFPQYDYATVPEIGCLVIKPLTYMNDSGDVVKYILDEYPHLHLSDILIIADDIHLPFGTLRFRKQGSAGGHNGLKSIEISLNTSDYQRMRFGIDTPTDIDLIDHVLGDFTPEEDKVLSSIIPSVANIIKGWVLEGIDSIQSRYNGSLV